MARTLTISNVLAHEAFEAEIAPGATLITGENSAGKTSIARVLAALTTHNTNPARLSATLAKTYLKKGAVEGFASLSDGARWIIPSKMEVVGDRAPETGVHMVGLVDFIGSPSASAADRAAIYEALFLPDDPAQILEPVWKGSRQQLDAVLKIIRSDKGWKGAFSVYDQQKKEAGRRWADTTGQRYTKKRGPQWRPDDWEADLEGLSEDDVLTALTEAQDALRAAGVRQAVEQDRVDRGIEARDVLVPAKEKEVADLEKQAQEARAELEPLNARGLEKRKDVEEAKTNLEAVDRAIAVLKAPDEAPEDVAPPHTCPSCGTNLHIVDGELAPWAAPQPMKRDEDQIAEELATLETQREVVEKHLANASELFKKLSAEYTAKREEADNLAGQYNQALGVLRELRRQAGDAELKVGDSNEAERSSLENDRDRADQRRKAWVRNRDAQRAHENYVEYEAICHLLGPTGARAQHMQKHMDRVRKALESISAKSGWRPITITDAYEVISGGYPAVLAAANEKSKCQWAIQAALTMLDKDAHWLILDAADQLRGNSWEGLETLVEALTAKRPDLYIVVCATESAAPEGWAEIRLGEAA